MITDVYLYTNGLVMTFDENGEQLPDYQGLLENVKSKILADAPATATFFVGAWRRGQMKIPKEQWALLRKEPTHDPAAT